MSLSTSKEEEREFILQLISVYKNLPILWNTKSHGYFNRQKKSEAYDILLEKYREKYPQAVREDVKKKLNSLRTNFRKELKRVTDLKKCETGFEHQYETSLWYFKDMLFLKDQGTPSQSTHSIETEEEGTGNETSTLDDSLPSPQNQLTWRKKREQQRNQYQQDEYVASTCKCLHNPDENDDYLKLAAAWVVELKKLDPKQQIFAKKAINDILFEGQMGTLSRHSVQINILQSRPSTPCEEKHTGDW